MKLMCWDPGFAGLGWAVLDVRRDRVERVESGVLSTKKESKKRKLHVGSDDARRIDLLARELRALVSTFAPALVAYELPAASKGARAGHALGIAHATVRLCARHLDDARPIVEVTVLDARRAALGRATGKTPESEVHDVLRRRFFADEPKPEAHELDAVAVGLAALETEIVKAMLGAAA